LGFAANGCRRACRRQVNNCCRLPVPVITSSRRTPAAGGSSVWSSLDTRRSPIQRSSHAPILNGGERWGHNIAYYQTAPMDFRWGGDNAAGAERRRREELQNQLVRTRWAPAWRIPGKSDQADQSAAWLGTPPAGRLQNWCAVSTGPLQTRRSARRDSVRQADSGLNFWAAKRRQSAFAALRCPTAAHY
jgi:hypothetical protein